MLPRGEVPEVRDLEQIELLQRRRGDPLEQCGADLPERTAAREENEHVVELVELGPGEEVAGREGAGLKQTFERRAIHGA